MSDAAFAESCHFATERLTVTTWREQLTDPASRGALATRVSEILTANVAKTLPQGWQGIATQNDALAWIDEMSEEGEVFAIRLTASDEIIGFLTMFIERDAGLGGLRLHLGYFLAESNWGQGLGGELIAGLVAWCQGTGRDALNVREIVGFVEPDNAASAKVLTRNGFEAAPEARADGMVAYKHAFAPPD